MTPQEFTARHFLTIHVMAYENANCVLALLSSLLPFTRPNVCIVVGDNSDKTTDVRDTVAALAASGEFGNRLLYHSYGVNIGIIGAILRPFDLARSPYLWVVGACNQFRGGALDILLPILEQHRPDVFLHYEDNLWRTQNILEQRTYGDALSLIRDHSHSIATSINSMVYATSKMAPLLPMAYEAASSLAPHTAMIYEGLRRGVLTVRYHPVAIFHRKPRRRVNWSMETFLKRLDCTLPVEVPQAEREAFFRELARTDEWVTWPAEVHEAANGQ